MLILSLFSLTLATIVLGVSVRKLQDTTLVTAGGWGIGGIAAWWLAVLCSSLNLASAGTVDVLFFATAVLLLCPGIAVLGARRPGAGAWNFFVLVPLLAVLLWPALASSQFLQVESPLELESPPLIGFALVLIMGIGNYFGTRFTLPSLLHTTTLVLIAASMSPWADHLPTREACRAWASVTFAMAIVVASIRAGDPAVGLEPLDRLWLDFVDQFGLVWAKRVMDRLNESARHENWSAEFQWHRIHWKPDTTAEDRQRTEERIEHTVRRLLKRFVEQKWIDNRLVKPPQT